MSHGHIDIPRWKEFQHRDATRTDSAVTWIKDFTRQLSRDNYLDLTFHQRGILHGIRLEYARGGAHVIVADTRRLTHRLGARVTMRDLRALEKAGFIELRDAPANHAADTRRQRDVNAADTRQTTDRHLTDASTHTAGPPNQATHDENTPASSQQKGQQPARVQENQEIQPKAVLTALPGGGQPDETDSLGNTFENILKEMR